VNLTYNVTRSNVPHREPLTHLGDPLPVLHLNARSRYITTDEILAVFVEESTR
jgi:hypothetical protein